MMTGQKHNYYDWGTRENLQVPRIWMIWDKTLLEQIHNLNPKFQTVIPIKLYKGLQSRTKVKDSIFTFFSLILPLINDRTKAIRRQK